MDPCIVTVPDRTTAACSFIGRMACRIVPRRFFRAAAE
jgi:hypothetical protein